MALVSGLSSIIRVAVMSISTAGPLPTTIPIPTLLPTAVRWLYLLVITDAHWKKLTRALDMVEGEDEELDKLRGRKKQRERVEAAVRAAVGKYDYEEAARRLNDAGVGFTEVMPLERVLEAPQARQPGKLRDLSYRGLDFEVPEFPGQREIVPDIPPPELGEHSVDLLRELGYSDEECAAMLEKGAVKVAGDDEFVWHKVKKKPS